MPSVITGSDSNSDFFKEVIPDNKVGPLLITSSISSIIVFSGCPLLGAISLISSSSSSIYSISGICLTNSSNPS